MLDTGALSPEVKKLFAQVATHAENYKRAFARLDQAVDSFEVDRQKVTQDIDDVRTEIRVSIKKLENYANKSVEEFKDKTEKTHSLFLELDKIDKLKLELYDLRDDIKNQTIDLSNSLVEFNTKADGQLEKTIGGIKGRLNKVLDEEITVIEQKVTRHLVNIDKNMKIFEKRIYMIDASVKGDVKKLAGEIDYVYNSITEIKADVSNYFKPLIQKVQELETEVPKITKTLDNLVAKVNDKLGSVASAPVASVSEVKPSEVHAEMEENFDAGEGNYDDSSFDFDTPFGDGGGEGEMSDHDLIQMLKDELETLTETGEADARKNMLALMMSIIAIVGVILVGIINFL